MINYITLTDGTVAAEIHTGPASIREAGDILDIMAEVGYTGCDTMIIGSASLHPDFFDLKTGLAGEILQKFSNYRMRLAITGDFSVYSSKSLNDFIRESNRRGIVCFAGSVSEATAIFGKKGHGKI